jgi:REP element-mobilizing transposase RayT
MARIPRLMLFDPAEVGVYHCINRCVRRAFLCGVDPLTGKNFDHRKDWIQGRLQFLAGHLGIDILGFAVMSNHVHVILRNRPDIVKDWTDEEVAKHWWNVFPLRRNRDGTPAAPNETDLAMITGDEKRLKEIRQRLSSISWFMRCLAEPIARRANQEDECRGRFWEGRFKAQPLLDDSALAACLAYVDLNPIRAQIAETPEESRYTSVYERIQATQRQSAETATQKSAAKSKRLSKKAAERELMKQQVRHEASIGIVRMQVPESPSVTTTGGTGETKGGRAGAVAAKTETPKTPPPAIGDAWLSLFDLSAERKGAKIPAARASNKGCLGMTFGEYLQLLDWTGRQIRPGKRGAIPAGIAPILERLSVSEEGWLKLVTEFSRMFRRSAGTPESLDRDAAKWGHKRREGIAHSQGVFHSRS